MVFRLFIGEKIKVIAKTKQFNEIFLPDKLKIVREIGGVKVFFEIR